MSQVLDKDKIKIAKPRIPYVFTDANGETIRVGNHKPNKLGVK